MTSRSMHDTIGDLQLLLQEFEQVDPAHHDASLVELERILRARIGELKASVRLLSTTDAPHDIQRTARNPEVH